MGKISSYPPDTSPTGDDQVITVDGSTGSNRRVTIANLLTYLFNNIPGAAVTTPKLSTALQQGWEDSYGTTAFPAPNSVVCNGNRSYTLTFNSVDLTGAVSAGMRLRTTRTVAAPTQCTSLNGTTQSYSKATPAGMTWTDDFVGGTWIKLNSYKAAGMTIISRYNGTSGFTLVVLSAGQIQLAGFNAGAGNVSYVQSYQSIPLNKWVHVAAQLDMSAFTPTPTTSYVMLDGVDVPSFVARVGTNPTALVQAGSLEIGSQNSGTVPLDGKLAQAFVSSAKITQSNILTLLSQGLTAALITANSIASAYSFNNDITDLNTTNANNLTANGLATANNTDSPFGGQASGSISSTLDYAIIQKVTFSTNTTMVVDVAEGCTIPTSGGVSAVVYSALGSTPYGFPGQRGKWQLIALSLSQMSAVLAVSGTWVSLILNLTVPLGERMLGYNGTVQSATNGAAGTRSAFFTLASSAPTNNVTTQYLTSRLLAGPGIQNLASTVHKNLPDTETAATVYTMYAASDSITVTETGYLRGDQGPFSITADNAYL